MPLKDLTWDKALVVINLHGFRVIAAFSGTKSPAPIQCLSASHPEKQQLIFPFMNYNGCFLPSILITPRFVQLLVSTVDFSMISQM